MRSLWKDTIQTEDLLRPYLNFSLPQDFFKPEKWHWGRDFIFWENKSDLQTLLTMQLLIFGSCSCNTISTSRCIFFSFWSHSVSHCNLITSLLIREVCLVFFFFIRKQPQLWADACLCVPPLGSISQNLLGTIVFYHLGRGTLLNV